MKRILSSLFVLGSFTASAQFTASFHQSNLPFVGFNYEIKDRFKPEVRIGTDTYFEDFSFEGNLLFDFLNKEDYEFYGGVGVRANGFNGVVIPVGLNVYPFTEKKFGFHIELAPIFAEDEDYILRGSWGIRYRFKGV